MAILDRVKRAWNAFRAAEQRRQVASDPFESNIGPSTSLRPDRPRPRFTNERTIVSAIYNRIAMDVAAAAIRHVKVNEDGQYVETVNSGLNDCLQFEANMDQSPRHFRQDMVMTMFEKGSCAVVAVDSVVDENEGMQDVLTVRVGEIVQWYPRHVRVHLYNEELGVKQDLVLEKKTTAIIENPLFAVMNEPNSTYQRLLRKLALLDVIDEQAGSGKMDLIIQLPYTIKSEARRQQAEQRRTDIEFQLQGSKYGIAYTDGTEKITQLNRPAENNLLKTVEYLVAMLHDQLGITPEIMNNTATEAAMLGYMARTVQPIVDAITENMTRALLGPAKYKLNERIMYFRNPFELVPLTTVADIADKFTRNEILTTNEIRSFLGIRPSKDPKADQLVNSNMPQPQGQVSQE